MTGRSSMNVLKSPKFAFAVQFFSYYAYMKLSINEREFDEFEKLKL